MTTSNLSRPPGAPWPVAKTHWSKDRSLDEGTFSHTAELQRVQPGTFFEGWMVQETGGPHSVARRRVTRVTTGHSRVNAAAGEAGNEGTERRSARGTVRQAHTHVRMHTRILSHSHTHARVHARLCTHSVTHIHTRHYREKSMQPNKYFPEGRESGPPTKPHEDPYSWMKSNLLC